MKESSSTTTSDVHPMVPVPEAIRIVLRETARNFLSDLPGRPPRVESVPVNRPDRLINQTLAKDVLMQPPGYPPYRASIMDGYCIKSVDKFTPGQAWTHKILDKVFAGDEHSKRTAAEAASVDTTDLPTAYYVTTGARVPNDYDCVVPVEDILIDPAQEKIAVQRLPSQTEKWIRPVGCDIAAGSCVLPAGHLMDAVSLGLVRQSGNSNVQLRRKVRVGVLSTGNELLVEEWDPVNDGVVGKIPDVNRPILIHLFENLGVCEVQDLGNCRDDDPAAMGSAIRQALATCEVVVTTGGISMGETDIVEDVLVQQLQGKLHFGRLHMKPGKPSTFVTIPSNGTTRYIFALPGNPVSAVVCSHLLVRPCLDLLYEGPDASIGECVSKNSLEEWITRVVQSSSVTPPEIMVKLSHDIPLDPERPEYHRVKLQLDTVKNTWTAVSTGTQRSSRLLSLRDADALLALPQGSASQPKALDGDLYPALLFKKDILPRIKVSESRHLNMSRPAISFRVGLVQLGGGEGLENLKERVMRTLVGSTGNSPFVFTTKRKHEDNIEQLYDFITEDTESDLHVVVGSSDKGSFASNSKASAHLRSKLVKVTDAIALQMRRGASVQIPTTALFENLVGIVPGQPNSILVFVPAACLENALGNVRGLLRHSLKICRGANHSQ